MLTTMVVEFGRPIISTYMYVLE